MLNIHDLIRLTKAANASAWHRTIVFDGKVAVSMNNASGPNSGRWWAGVPYTQAAVDEPVAVPVDTITAHLLKSRHLFVAKDHVHNNQGLRTAWSNKPHDWSNALADLPPRPEGECIQFDLDLDALDRVLVVVDPKDIRQSVTGVFLNFETGQLAGTDGARVHLYDFKVPKLVRKQGQTNLQLIVPKAPAHWLLKSDDKHVKVTVWKLGTGQSLVLMQTSEALVYTVAIDAKYPDVMRVMPKRGSFGSSIRLNPIQFSDAVAAMAKVVALKNPKFKTVTVHWGEGRVYAGHGPDFLPFEHELLDFGADRDKVAKTLYATYQPQFLQDVADCVTPKAFWCVPTPISAGRTSPVAQVLAVFDEDFSAVVMPTNMQSPEPPTDKPKEPKKPAKSGPKTTPKKQPAKPSKPVPAATVPPKPEKPATGPENKPKPAPKAQIQPGKPGPAAKEAESPAPVVLPPSKTVH